MRKLLILLCITVIGAVPLHAQKDTVYVQGAIESGQEGTLNDAIEAAQADGSINNTVFKLTSYDYYVLTSTIEIDVGETLEIVGPTPGTTQASAPPQIMWTSSGGIDTEYNILTYGDITLKNVWLRYADVQGNQIGSALRFADDPDPDEQERGVFEGVIFDYAPSTTNGSGSVSITADHFVGIFKNSYFRNNVDPHFRYYGRAVSFPYQSSGWHIDSVLFENTTFANMGYVLMQEGAEWSDNVHFNHCTFLNIAMFSLESGWWHNMHVTNSIFVNPFMYGYIPAQVPEGAEPNGGVFSIAEVDSFGFEVDFTDPERQILYTHSSYIYEDWLLDWMENNPYSKEKYQNREEDLIPMPQPMLNQATMDFMDSTDADGNRVHPLMNRAFLYEDVNPRFIEPATNHDSLKAWLLKKWDTNEDTNWAYKPEAGYNQTWPLPENMAYENDTLLTAGMGEFPLGDLYHWFPDKYEEWKAQRSDEVDRIHTWMETGKDPTTGLSPQSDGTITAFTLEQNYPNPFNPTTSIKYSVPKTDHVVLAVYNSLGQEVVTLYEGRKAAGTYTATFDGTDLPSGVYFYRLQSDDVSFTKKLVLLK
ncbi:MAG: T9SS type A sorting domain-containing protein [Candidatus Marinimicrobia bacterium]|nr:T9SS type A sorting domain-containing protein [Candidatus Neomarinimicrobiota bacterium]MCF7880605.1 T9SS type A sorting domain-containing protein [Candidatus Neomarinimicrobiota bacterium]